MGNNERLFTMDSRLRSKRFPPQGSRDSKCQKFIQVYGYPTKYFAIAFLTVDPFEEGGKMEMKGLLFFNLYPLYVPCSSVLFTVGVDFYCGYLS